MPAKHIVHCTISVFMNFTKHLLQDIDCLRCSIRCAQFSPQISLDLILYLSSKCQMSWPRSYSFVDLSSLAEQLNILENKTQLFQRTKIDCFKLSKISRAVKYKSLSFLSLYKNQFDCDAIDSDLHRRPSLT